MRWQFKVLVVVAMGFAVLELAQSQAQVPGGGFGGGGGIFGAKTVQNPIALLQMKAVKDEIKLTDEQGKKVDDAVWKALGTVLEGEQLKRLKQIDIQQKDYKAFADPAIQTSLKMTAEQKSNIQTIMEDADKELADAMKEGFGGGGGKGNKGGGAGGAFEKIQTIAKETKERVTAVLTKEQKRNFNEMVGEKFEFPAIGGGGKKKKDGE